MKDNPILRTMFYMNHWLTNNPESYKRVFGDKDPAALTMPEYRELFRIATTHDTLNLAKK